MKLINREKLLLSYIQQSKFFTSSIMTKLTNSRWLILGGSGFVGRWLTLFGQEISVRSDSPSMVTIASRDPQRTRIKLRNFLPSQYVVPKVISIHDLLHNPETLMDLNGVDTIFHAATPTDRQDQSILELPSLTTAILDICQGFDLPKFIHLSSGGVYPRERFFGQLIPEGANRVSVSQSVNAYQQVKVTLEQLVESATESGKVRGANPRLFAFAGPGFPIDGTFAFSDFMRSALLQKPIEIRGNPATCRSYMHPVNMVEWLISLSVRIDQVGLDPVHIGSHIPISMMDLATRISQDFGGIEVRYSEKGKQDAEWYVPEVLRMRSLGCDLELSTLDEILDSWKVYLAPQHSAWS
jgi:nucleoside-diphosphate-sugar epimerase